MPSHYWCYRHGQRARDSRPGIGERLENLPKLTNQRKEELEQNMSTYSRIFPNVPGKTDWNLKVRVKHYPLPFPTFDDIEAEVQQTKALDLIELSGSIPQCYSWTSRTKPNVLWSISGARIMLQLQIQSPCSVQVPFLPVSQTRITSLDFVRGYWLFQQSKPKTAFSTKSGLYQCFAFPTLLTPAANYFPERPLIAP